MKKVFLFLLHILGLFFAFSGNAQNIPTAATAPSGTTAAAATFARAYDWNPSDTPTIFNYTRTWLPNIPVSDTGSYILKLGAVNSVPTSTIYTDGFGRNLMTIKHGRNIGSKDVIQPYDNRSSATRLGFLPYATGGNTRFKNNLNTFNDEQSYYNTAYAKEGGASYISTVGTYNNGVPASVVFRSGLSFVGQNIGDTTSMTFNTTGAIPSYFVNNNGHIDGFGNYYQPGTLMVKTLIGQNNKKQIAYFDRNHKLICKKVYAGTDASSSPIWLTTNYVYNNLGKLAFVMPPKATASSPTGYSLRLVSQCFTYLYDRFGNLIEKRMPEKNGVESEVYDAKHRPVLYQTPLMKAEGKWAYTIYDNNNRAVMTGLISDANTRITWQSWADGTITPSGGVTSGSLLYFILNGVTGTYPSSILLCDINTIKYYDTYPAFANSFSDTFSSVYLTGSRNIRPAPYNFTPGMLTAIQVRIMDPLLTTPTYISSVFFYDFNGQLIQAQTQNPWNTSSTSPWDITTIQYSFAGQKVLEAGFHHSWSASDKLTTKLVNFYNYDSYYNRLVSVQQQADGGSVRDIAYYTYDELGRVKEKKIGGIEIQDYQYNIRGQLQGINADYVSSPTIADKTYGCELSYDYGFSQSRMDGDISGVVWRGSGTGSKLRAYGYSYDAAGRLTDADFRELDGSSWSKSTVDMSMNGVTYDESGNILTMNQMGTSTSGPVQIDQLNYTYSNGTNKLLAVSDGIKTDYKIGDFQDVTPNCTGMTETGGGSSGPPPGGPAIGLSICPDYYYDVDGNLITDSNKHIHLITYNELDEPLTITTDSGTITNVYDAGGTLIQKTILNTTLTTPSSTILRYWGPFVYQNDSLQYVLHQEGRARWLPDSSLFKYDFFITDYLGNVRTVITSDEYAAPLDYFASHEIASAGLESSMFANLDAVRDLKPGSTNPYDVEAAHLNGNSPSTTIGTAILLNVMAGDKFDISAESYWNSDSANLENNADPSTMLGSIVSTLISGTGGYNQEGNAATYVNNLFTSTNYLGAYQSIIDSLTDSTAPQAYINYMVFDNQMNLVPGQSGVIQVSNVSGSWQVIGTTTPITIGQNGYLSVFMSDAAGMPVYMDKLSIDYYKGRLLQEQNYYPHGLAVNEGKRSGYMPDNFLFQSNEVHNENGINLADFNARHYDYQIGRFISIDPMADHSGQESLSPYHSFANNPACVADPSGLDPTTDAQISVSNMNDYNYLWGGNFKSTSLYIQANDQIMIDETFDITDKSGNKFEINRTTIDFDEMPPESDPGPSALASQGIDIPNVSPTVQVMADLDPGGATLTSGLAGIVGGLWGVVQGIGEFFEHPLDNSYNMLLIGLPNQTGIAIDPGRYLAIMTAQSQKMDAIENQFNNGNIYTKAYMIGYGIGTILPMAIAPETEIGEAATVGGEVATDAGDVSTFTRSNMQLGQEMHRAYKIAEEDKITTFREFRDVPGVRPDFVDFNTNTIYELKPFNPRAMQQGMRQLSRYKNAFEDYYPGTSWNTVLDTY